MEKNIAILIADLSGYTALTETHGAIAAADLIDQYLAIVQKCLTGESRLAERVGDQVMIISPNPASLLSTALMILQNSSTEDKFLQVHGGLHYGAVLTRNGRFFGSAINIAARLAAKANAGTCWCSQDFFQRINIDSSFKYRSMGEHRFKNLNEQIDITEVKNPDPELLVTDPVCKMLLRDEPSAIRHPDINDLLFCSQDCLNIYKQMTTVNPGQV